MAVQAYLDVPLLRSPHAGLGQAPITTAIQTPVVLSLSKDGLLSR
jgi:hypothetical protein